MLRYRVPAIIAFLFLSVMFVSAQIIPPVIDGDDLSFQIKGTYPLPNRPDVSALDDLNNDDRPDLVIANRFGFSISVLINNGDGFFRQRVDYDLGVELWYVITADFDSDGDKDIAYTSPGVGKFGTLRNLGNGTFDIWKSYTLSDHVQAICAFDMDNDGDSDIAASNWRQGTVVFMKNFGNGVFLQSDTAHQVGINPSEIVAAELTGDTLLDLVVVNAHHGFDQGSLSILRNRGNGTFENNVTIPLGRYPLFLAGGDINEDGRTDIAVIIRDDHNVAILENQGTGSFSVNRTIAVGTTPTSIRLEDIDQDNHLDLIVVNSHAYSGTPGSVSIHSGDGQGNFTQTTVIPAGMGPRTSSLGDLDGDGDLDITYTSWDENSVTVLENITEHDTTIIPKETPVIHRVKDVPFDQGGKVSLFWTASTLDTNTVSLPYYSIWRALPDDGEKESPTSPRQYPGQRYQQAQYRYTTVNGITTAWEWIANQPSHRFKEYSFTAPTLFNAMPGTRGMHLFMVSAQTADPNVFYDSNVKPGFSVDNLPPHPIDMLASERVPGANAVKLTWERNPHDTDIHSYIVHRSLIIEFVPGEATEIGNVREPVFIDDAPPAPISGAVYYRIVAKDIHGNEGLPSSVVVARLTGAEAATSTFPEAFTLEQNFPNPFNPTTEIRYTLPVTSYVRLSVFNILGEEVAVLVNGQEDAGFKSVSWQSVTNTGYDLPSGVYICRIEATDATEPTITFTKIIRALLMR